MKKIILRLDLNVPIKDGKILDTRRIDVVLNDIKNLLKNKKHEIIILSHIGKGEKNNIILPIEKYLRKKLNKEENQRLKIHENIRFIKGEIAKVGNKEYNDAVKYFSSLGEEYINDAFSVLHRDNASIVGLPKSFIKEKRSVKMGEYTKKEIKNLEKSLEFAKNPKNKTLLILSGAKISTKLPLIKKFLSLKAKIFIAGGIANQIFKEVLNIEIGKSFIENDFEINEKDKNIFLKEIKNKNIILPIDAILKDNQVKIIEGIKKDDYISDIGPATFAILKKEIKESKNIIMNGPLGIYEDDFNAGTIATLKELKKNKVNILIGGGDTLVLVKKVKIKDEKNIYISTAGGAMLEFLAKDGKLPGILALK